MRSVVVSCRVNGVPVVVEVAAWHTLAELLREHLDMTGTKLGCNRGECGACTVLLEGKPVFSCTTLAADANGKEIGTVEGLSSEGNLHPLQAAFIKHDALQCGFCTPGILMALEALIEKNPNPSREEVKNAVAGNYCRCGAYLSIFDAALEVARDNK